jgi:hypothetical protein
MPKGKAWTYTERETLIEGYSNGKTINQLTEMLPGRSKKAIYREIEKLRDKGVLGYKNLLDKKRSQYDASTHKNQRKESRGLKGDDWGVSDWD